jgi:hypothetical protein
LPLGDRSGHAVSSAGDINGDGLDDLIVGAYGANPNGIDSGKAYIIFGKTDTNAHHLSSQWYIWNHHPVLLSLRR